MNRIATFQKELNHIERKDILEFSKMALNSLPEYFFEVPASSTGKYHPAYALGKEGLTRHVKAAIGIAMELFRCESVFHFSKLEQDIIITSLLLHDGCKSGRIKQKFTQNDHPLQVISLLKELDHNLHEELFNSICDCIETHMGQWNTDRETGEQILPVPKTEMQKFVHLCDYLASRKCLEFTFDI